MTQTERILQQVTDKHIDNSPNEFTGINTGHDSYCSIPFVREAMQTCAIEFAAWVSSHTRVRLKDGVKYLYDRTLSTDSKLHTIDELFKIWEEQQ